MTGQTYLHSQKFPYISWRFPDVWQIYLPAFYSKFDLEADDNAIMVNSGIMIGFLV